MSRLADLARFYSLLDRLEQRVGGNRVLTDLGGFRDWPKRGVYLFFEPSEGRCHSGEGPRVVRVGTHALGEGPGAFAEVAWALLSLGLHRDAKQPPTASDGLE